MTLYYDGLPACSCLVAWCPAFEKAIGRKVTWWQLDGNAPASAGFHKGGGSGDCPMLTEDELRTARNMGAAAWNRPWEDNHHAHLRLNGCPHNTIAQRQVPDLNAGRDGTGPLGDNIGPRDNGPRDGVHWPLRTWREGIEWAKSQEDDMPNYRDWSIEDKKALAKDVADAVWSRAVPIPGEPKSRSFGDMVRKAYLALKK